MYRIHGVRSHRSIKKEVEEDKVSHGKKIETTVQLSVIKSVVVRNILPWSVSNFSVKFIVVHTLMSYLNLMEHSPVVHFFTLSDDITDKTIIPSRLKVSDFRQKAKFWTRLMVFTDKVHINTKITKIFTDNTERVNGRHTYCYRHFHIPL